MIELLGYSALSLLFVKYFSPIQPVREWIVNKLINFMIKYKLWFLEYLVQILTCPFCFSFWLTLGLTLSLYKAAIVSVLTMIVLYTTESLLKYLSDESK